MITYEDGIKIRREANNIYQACLLACSRAENISEEAYDLAYQSLTDARRKLVDIEIAYPSKAELAKEFKVIKHRNRWHND